MTVKTCTRISNEDHLAAVFILVLAAMMSLGQATLPYWPVQPFLIAIFGVILVYVNAIRPRTLSISHDCIEYNGTFVRWKIKLSDLIMVATTTTGSIELIHRGWPTRYLYPLKEHQEVINVLIGLGESAQWKTHFIFKIRYR